MALQQVPSPLDKISNLKPIPLEQVRALENHLSRTYTPRVRTQEIASRERAMEMRNKLLL